MPTPGPLKKLGDITQVAYQPENDAPSIYNSEYTGSGPGHVIEFLQPVEDSEGLFAMRHDAVCNWNGSDTMRMAG